MSAAVEGDEIAGDSGAPVAPVIDGLIGHEGVRLRALRWEIDEPRGRVLVVHGLGEHAGRYDLLAGALAGAGYSVMAYDLRGHGESEGRRGHVESFGLFVEDLARCHREAADRLPGSGDPFLVGHSMGGLILIRYLQLHRPATSGAVLSAPWLATAVDIPRWKRLVGRALERVAPSFPVTTALRPELLTSDPRQQRRYEEDSLVHRRVSPGLWSEVEAAQEAALASELPEDLDVLVLLPGDDRVTDVKVVRAWCDAMTSSTVQTVVLPGLRHEPFNEIDRDAVFARVTEWMAQRPSHSEP